MKKILTTTIIVMAIVVAGCSSSSDATSTTSTPSDDGVVELETAVADVESSLLTVQAEAEATGLTDEAAEAWNDLESEIDEAMASVSTLDFAAVDTDALRGEVATFAGVVEEAGDELSDEFREAWDALRANLETMLNAVTN